ncbi:MAG: Bax inhibitor-1/YccA family protein [Alphaproteobacteria bacterium]|nr:Bax inhibitor-1/YccA family protein [Alphaproteobacteria bacterium]
MTSDSNNKYYHSAQATAIQLDVGLRTYMLGVYNYMAAGLGLTGLIAYLVGTSPELLRIIYGTPLAWIVMLAPLGFALFFGFRIHKMQASTAQILFWAFAGVMGLSLSYIFAVYTAVSVAKVFFITAATFAALSLYGYTTKKDLSGFGSFLFIGLIGIIIASIVNIFLASTALQFAVSIVGVLIFAGLTAYDTQMIKEEYDGQDNNEMIKKKSILGALRLYLDFINLFISLLQIMGNRN